MKTNFFTLLASSLTLLFFTGAAMAGDREKMVIELKTNDFQVAETDISNLSVGEAKTILTDSGKTVDILRTEDGVEIYVDGELLEMPEMHEAHDQAVHEHVEVVCVSDGEEDGSADSECDHDMMFFSDEDIDIEALGEHGTESRVIVKRVQHECESDQEGECEDEQVWVSDGSDVAFGELHETGEGKHRIVRIHKSVDGDNSAESTAEKVIIIKKKSEEEL